MLVVVRAVLLPSTNYFEHLDVIYVTHICHYDTDISINLIEKQLKTFITVEQQELLTTVPTWV